MSIKRSLLLVVIAGFLLRALLAFGYEGTGDTGTWRLGGRTGLEKVQLGMGNGTVYDGDCPALCSNWPPLTFHYMVMMRWASVSFNPFQFPDAGYYKLFPFVADTATILLIYAYAKKRRLQSPLALAATYAFHPIALYVAGYHGQRDTIWVFFTLLSVYLLEFKNTPAAAVMFAVGTSIKIPSLLVFPFLLLRQKQWLDRVILAGLAVFFFVLLNSPELLIYFDRVFKQVFLYQGWTGRWGLGGVAAKVDLLLPTPFFSQLFGPVHKIFLYASVLAANVYFGRRSKDLVIGALGVITTVLIASPAFASQYLVWALPFILLLPARYHRYKVWYTILGTYMAMTLYSAIPFLRPLEILLLELPAKQIYYKLANFAYPMDTAWPVWILLGLLLYRLVYDVEHKKKTRIAE